MIKKIEKKTNLAKNVSYRVLVPSRRFVSYHKIAMPNHGKMDKKPPWLSQDFSIALNSSLCTRLRNQVEVLPQNVRLRSLSTQLLLNVQYLCRREKYLEIYRSVGLRFAPSFKLFFATWLPDMFGFFRKSRLTKLILISAIFSKTVEVLFGCLVGFLTSYRGQAIRQSV